MDQVVMQLIELVEKHLAEHRKFCDSLKEGLGPMSVKTAGMRDDFIAEGLIVIDALNDAYKKIIESRKANIV